MSTLVTNAHDVFFKQVLAEPESAGQFLREHLPTEVVELLGPELPEPLPASFVDEQLREHHSDLLFRMHLKGGEEAFTYLLLEHKSSPDESARLQLLRYVVRVLENCFEKRRRRLPLPPVLPLLIHQGPPEWAFSCQFVDLFGAVPDGLRPYLPDFRHALVDLAAMDDEALSTAVRLRALLKALKYGRSVQLPERLEFILADAGTLERRDLLLILTYLDKAPIGMSLEALRQFFHHRIPKREEEVMGWFSQPILEEGIQRGRVEGRAEGHAAGNAQGRATSLVRLLEKRFGNLPTDLQDRVFAADLQVLDSWFDRAIDAIDLQSVFVEPVRAHLLNAAEPGITT